MFGLRPSRRRLAFVLLMVLGSGIAAAARADIVLHEYIPPDAAEDLAFGATTSDGTMAAAIETQSGPLAAPDLERPSASSRRVYGNEPSGQGGSFRIDSDTSRPARVSYDDPFTPAVAPYKREFVFDTVDANFDLGVRDPSLTKVAVGGAARLDDDQFYADLDVSLSAGTVVRIPAAGPGQRLLAVRAVPPARLDFSRDGAENWFVRGETEGRVRVILHLAVDRAVFGSPFADVEWPRLYRLAPPLSDGVKREGLRVARQIGVVDGTGPAEALRILVRYFRGFEPSKERLDATGAELYRQLALSKKGVCRHRAYAFVVTALALGLPSRFVHNEAHAWVEVSDGVRYHRIDLGGAADELDFADGRVAHVPPRDPFDWPDGGDSGQAMADRARAERGLAARGGRGPATASSSSSVSTQPPEEERADDEDHRPKSAVTLSVDGSEARRGARLHVSGRVGSGGSPCAEVRVDLFLEPSAASGSREKIPLGTLVTNDEGRYDGRVVVPYAVPPGDYEVRASTPGGTSCGEGQSHE